MKRVSVILPATAAGLLAALLVATRRPAGPPVSAPTRAWVMTDFAGDGTPDFLRLRHPADRQAFLGWFTFLAEALYYMPPEARPREVVDCAALIRFAYREGLRRHDAVWAAELGLPTVPALPDITQYNYPFTPLGPRIFRVLPGAFRPEDINSKAFAEFADARTLAERNCHYRGRDVRRAEPGDLLIYRQDEQDSPFHAMIYLGASQIERRAAGFVIYHTGPDAKHPGEIRRPELEELLRHPSARWRPVEGNRNFLGVFRWNILREGE